MTESPAERYSQHIALLTLSRRYEDMEVSGEVQNTGPLHNSELPSADSNSVLIEHSPATHRRKPQTAHPDHGWLYTHQATALMGQSYHMCAN